MLFLLESKPLMGDTAYERLFEIVSEAYRNTAAQHADDFLPFFLVNDIIRYWRTLLLNHEDRLRKKHVELENDGVTGEELAGTLLAHRKYRSQKLRFPRCLICFSTLAYLLALAPSDEDRISAEDERKMFSLTPIERLRAVGEIRPRTSDQTEAMIALYALYMKRTSETKKEVVSRLGADPEFARATSEGGLQFTKQMFHLIQDLGNGNRLHRQMLI